ncbi:MAG TPA: hypothetical protein VF756_24245 [Thermoanaerobaculia bacterium]
MAEKSKLDTIANIAIILVCLIAATILIRNTFFPPEPPRPPGAPEEAKVGERFEALQKVVPAGSERALVVALSPTCHFCTESMPFYKKLVDQRNQAGSPVKVIAAVPSQAAQAEESKTLSSAGVQPDAVVTVNFRDIKVPGTPTILLVDNKGEVLNVWVGKLDEGREEEVLETL